jgi:hypothetical protein
MPFERELVNMVLFVNCKAVAVDSKLFDLLAEVI